MPRYKQISLTAKNADDFISKIMYLEEHLGRTVDYKLLDLDELSPYKDDLNTLAKKIAEFVGVKSTFIVTRGAKDKGGDIECEGNFSYIDLNPTVCGSFFQTSAVLAHEIMHRYLNSKCLRYNLEIENEVLTDIATVYMGLGKLSLIGHCFVNTTRNGNTISKKTSEVGYLNMDSFCFVYLLICKLRKIEKDTYLFGLNDDVRERIKRVEYSSFFSSYSQIIKDEDPVLHYSHLLNEYDQKVNDCSALIDKLDELVRSLKGEQTAIREDIVQTGKAIKDLTELSFTEYNPVMRSLRKIGKLNAIDNTLSRCNNAINTLSIKTNALERLYEGPKDTKEKPTFKQKLSKIFKHKSR